MIINCVAGGSGWYVHISTSLKIKWEGDDCDAVQTLKILPPKKKTKKQNKTKTTNKQKNKQTNKQEKQ